MDVQELSHGQFLNSVCPIDLQVVRQAGLKEQIKNILLNGMEPCNHVIDHVIPLAVVIKFSQLCLLLGNSKPLDQVLQCVGIMATLVQSCWVVKRYNTISSDVIMRCFTVKCCIRMVPIATSMEYHVMY